MSRRWNDSRSYWYRLNSTPLLLIYPLRRTLKPSQQNETSKTSHQSDNLLWQVISIFDFCSSVLIRRSQNLTHQINNRDTHSSFITHPASPQKSSHPSTSNTPSYSSWAQTARRPHTHTRWSRSLCSLSLSHSSSRSGSCRTHKRSRCRRGRRRGIPGCNEGRPMLNRLGGNC